MYYSSIKTAGGISCKLPVENQDTQTVNNLDDLVVYTVDGTTYYYFANGNKTSFEGVLANNSGVGLTVPVYSVQNGASSVSYNGYVGTPEPSDYYSNIKSGNFTLVSRS